MRIILPEAYVTSPWKNGGGVTHEIARHEVDGELRWRLSIAEVAADGPFSRFEGLSRILTVIEGNGIDLLTPDGVMQARLCEPVAFSGDLKVESRMVDGPIRDLNVIFDARFIAAKVESVEGPRQLAAGPGRTGLLCLAGAAHVDGSILPPMAFALGDKGRIDLTAGARVALVSLSDSP